MAEPTAYDKMSDAFMIATPDRVEVRYVTANERLLEQLARLLEQLTSTGRPYILIISSDGQRIGLWHGQKAGLF